MAQRFVDRVPNERARLLGAHVLSARHERGRLQALPHIGLVVGRA